MKIEPEALGFEWDEGNGGKNKKHGIENSESEEAFFDEHKVILRDPPHSQDEERFILLGKTKKEKLLFVVFAKRGQKLRVIFARKVNKKEVPLYEKAA